MTLNDQCKQPDSYLFSRAHHPQYGSFAVRHWAHVEYWAQSWTFNREICNEKNEGGINNMQNYCSAETWHYFLGFM
jgi:hypothetical protein